MGYSGVSCFQEDALVARRIIEPGEFLVAEFRIEIRPLKREGVEPGRMTAEFERVPLGFRQQNLADPAPPQRGVDPEQVDEQPSGIAIADQSRLDRPRDFGTLVAHKDPEIRIFWVGQERRVIGAEAVIDELPILPGRVFLEAQAKPGRQIHRNPR